MLFFGVIGCPVKHSKSPLIHNAWLKANNIEGVYQLIEVENQEDLQEIFNTLPKMGYRGINVTVPYKNIILEIAKNAGFEIHPDAQTLQAVNTINFQKKQALNTDPYGFSKIFTPKEDDQILVVGAGGAASSVVMACQGANITITNRTHHKAEKIAEEFMCDIYNGELSKLDLANFDVIINATSLGLNGEELPLNYKTLQKQTKCIDIIYNPKVTPFLDISHKKGCKIENGAMMLVHQGAKSFHNWNGILPDTQSVNKSFLSR